METRATKQLRTDQSRANALPALIDLVEERLRALQHSVHLLDLSSARALYAASVIRNVRRLIMSDEMAMGVIAGDTYGFPMLRWRAALVKVLSNRQDPHYAVVIANGDEQQRLRSQGRWLVALRQALGRR
jgi:hypothetical protein